MLGLIIMIYTGFFGLLGINLFKNQKLDKMSGDKKVLFAREELKKVGIRILKRLRIVVNTVYEDEEDFKKLNKKTGVVFVSNHTSNLDIPCLMKGLPFDIGFVAKKEMETWPFFGKWMKASNCVFLDRKNHREGIKTMKTAVEIVKSGFPVIIFPQGTRKATFKENEFKKGSFKLATETGGVIVPVVIKGVSEIQAPNGAKVNMNRSVEIYICKSIKMSELSEEDIKKIDKIVEAKIREKFNSEK